MSHIVKIRTEIRDPQGVAQACQRLGLTSPVFGLAKLFSAEATGWQVRLPDWRYPVVCDTTIGELHYDNFNGRWGALDRLHQFQQAYAIEKTRLEARRRGHTLTEQSLADGSVKLTIQIGGVV